MTIERLKIANNMLDMARATALNETLLAYARRGDAITCVALIRCGATACKAAAAMARDFGQYETARIIDEENKPHMSPGPMPELPGSRFYRSDKFKK